MASINFTDIMVGEQVKGSRTISWNETGDSIMQIDSFNSQANNFFTYSGSLEQSARNNDYVMALRGYQNNDYSINGTVEFYIPSGAMNVSLYFNYGVDSETNYDWFTVIVDGVQYARISGSEIGYVSMALSSGSWHTISLYYSKDGSQSVSHDMGWIDDLQVSYLMPAPSTRYELSYSTNGSTWTAIYSGTSRSFVWDTTNVDSSTTMRLRVNGYLGSSLQSSVVSPIFSVLNVKSPLLTTPREGETIKGLYDITWTRPAGTHVSAPYEIEFSPDNGVNWKKISLNPQPLSINRTNINPSLNTGTNMICKDFIYYKNKMYLAYWYNSESVLQIVSSSNNGTVWSVIYTLSLPKMKDVKLCVYNDTLLIYCSYSNAGATIAYLKAIQINILTKQAITDKTKQLKNASKGGNNISICNNGSTVYIAYEDSSPSSTTDSALYFNTLVNGEFDANTAYAFGTNSTNPCLAFNKDLNLPIAVGVYDGATSETYTFNLDSSGNIILNKRTTTGNITSGTSPKILFIPKEILGSSKGRIITAQAINTGGLSLEYYDDNLVTSSSITFPKNTAGNFLNPTISFDKEGTLFVAYTVSASTTNLANSVYEIVSYNKDLTVKSTGGDRETVNRYNPILIQDRNPLPIDMIKITYPLYVVKDNTSNLIIIDGNWNYPYMYTDPSVLKFNYDFGKEQNTNTAKIRIRAYDAVANYYSPWNTSLYFKILNKSLIGIHKIEGNIGMIEIPIYDPLVGMDSKNQFRFKLANGNIGCYELVDITDALASPLRIKTPTAIKSIAKR